MKILKNTFTILFLLVTFSMSSQGFNSAVEYMNFVSAEQQQITKNMWKYTKAIAHSKSDRNIRVKRNTLIKTVERAILKIKNAKGYDGDEYKNQVLEHLNLNKNLLNQDYAKIIDMKEVAEQSYDAMEAYMMARELADQKMSDAQDEFEKNFYAYAEKHNIEITEGETDLGKKMKISNEVFEHYNKMYLIFFKVNINEIYLWEAIEKQDISAIQQNANSLSETAKEGLEILKTVELYKNDQSLLASTKAIFDFFIDEAENKVPKITDFLILNEDFESIKTTLDKTPERKRTKEQINNYNKKVKEINNAVKAYNKTNAELNTKRQKAFDNLNNTNDNFLSKHIPKD
ncbi:LIC11966 family surface protein [Urechidicola croceus]|uniref:Uncharacterized protein n=1 Tax=Urechidicola croceus TaxID=1850246 RepID=A0A1D8PAF9_9FLAO|nr:hypothetical protein [Urechidicola croceus]AOW21501.1 hypothetical protein LPB138_12785 [Urechidicola croceus]